MRWNIDPEIVSFGALSLRYYSLMFVIGFVSMEKYVKTLFVKHNKDPQLVSTLTVYIIAGTFIGARLAHVLFYDPAYYFSNPALILKVWEGGLASHGGFFGVIIATFLFLRKHKDISFLWLMDAIAGPCLFVGGLIRIGNFFNSEIVGKVSDVPWAIIFERVDPLPRHPAQLYEAIGYFCIAFILGYMFRRHKDKLSDGMVLVTAITLSFTFRFFIEFTKDIQSTLIQGSTINMGQILSVVFTAVGLGLWYKIRYSKK